MPNQYPVEALRHQEMLDSYLSFLGTSRRPETVAQHREKLRPLFRAWNDIEPTQWTRTRFVTWLSAKKARPQGFSPRNVPLVLTACLGFLTWAKAEGLTIPQFIEGIERPTVHLTRPKFLSLEEAKKVLAECRGTWVELFLSLAFYAGNRPRRRGIDEREEICLRDPKRPGREPYRCEPAEREPGLNRAGRNAERVGDLLHL